MDVCVHVAIAPVTAIHERRDMDCNNEEAGPKGNPPRDCWHDVLRFSDPEAIARVACVNQNSKAAAYDEQLWKTHFKRGLSPEYCVSA